MGASQQVYTSLKQKKSFSYANVRKASYRGSKPLNNYKYSNYFDHHHDISVQVLRDLGNFPNLVR